MNDERKLEFKAGVVVTADMYRVATVHLTNMVSHLNRTGLYQAAQHVQDALVELTKIETLAYQGQRYKREQQETVEHEHVRDTGGRKTGTEV